jgi:hypothetical protein
MNTEKKYLAKQYDGRSESRDVFVSCVKDEATREETSGGRGKDLEVAR